MSIGDHFGFVSVAPASAPTRIQLISVQFHIESPGPMIRLNPTIVETDYVIGGAAPRGTSIAIECFANCSTVPQRYTIPANSPSVAWFSVSRSGSVPGRIAVTFTSVSELGAGTYSDTVTVNVPGVPTNTLQFTVRLKVRAPHIEVSPEKLMFAGQIKYPVALTQSITVKGDHPLDLNISITPRTPPWLSASPTRVSGQTTATIKITVQPWLAPAVGTHASEVQITTTQSDGTKPESSIRIPVELFACSLAIKPGTLTFPAEGGVTDLVLDTPSGCPWTIKSPSWLVPSVASGKGGAHSQVRAVSNPSGTVRTAAVDVSGTSITATQSGGTCFTSLSANVTTFTAAGGDLALQVRPSPSDCRWGLVVAPTWITPTGYLSGQGSQQVHLTVAANKTDSVRTGTLQSGDATLTITQSFAPIIGVNSVTHGASYTVGPIAPGQLVVIYGIGLGPDKLMKMALDKTGLVSTILSGTRVWFDDFTAPLLYVSESQIAAMVPYALADRRSTAVKVEYSGVASSSIRYDIVASRPGILTADSSGSGQVAALNEDGSYNSEFTPARRGSVLVFFATGEGQTDPPGTDGRIAQHVLPRPLLPVKVFIGNREVDVYYAGAAPGSIAGILQVNVGLPADALVGSKVPIRLAIGDFTSEQQTTIAIE